MSGIEHDRLTSAIPREEDRAFDRAIRPKTLQDYVGQPSVKEQMDKKHGKSWFENFIFYFRHCIIGEGFAFSITYELKNVMYMFFNGKLAVLVFRQSI